MNKEHEEQSVQDTNQRINPIVPLFIIDLNISDGRVYTADLEAIRDRLSRIQGVTIRTPQPSAAGPNLLQLTGNNTGVFVIRLISDEFSTSDNRRYIYLVVTLADLYVVGIANQNSQYYFFNDAEPRFREINGFQSRGILANSGNYNALMGAGTVRINPSSIRTMYSFFFNFAGRESVNQNIIGRNCVVLITLVSEALRFWRVTSLMTGVLQFSSGNAIDWRERIRPSVLNWSTITDNFVTNFYPFDAIRWLFILAATQVKPR